MEVFSTTLKDVKLLKPYVFDDLRGEYLESYNEELYKEHNINIKFVQDVMSISTKHVLRGIHGDNETWKLFTCIHGKVYFVVVNCDTKSKDFGKWQSFILSNRNMNQVLVPPKYGNAHLILSDKAIFHYKQSTYYNPKIQFTYKWNDPKLNIWFPIKNPILSQRDELGHYII